MTTEHQDMMDVLADLGIDLMTQEALAVLPLVEVAWADGSVAREERAVIEAVARDQLDLCEEGLRLVQDWLKYRPSPRYFDHARRALVTLAESEDAFDGLGLDDIVTLATKVARAAGGFLGFGKISAVEAERLEAIRAALIHPPSRPSAQERSRASNERVTVAFVRRPMGGVLIVEQDGERRKMDVDAGGLLVGTSASCQVRLQGPGLHAEHFRVYEMRRKYYVDALQPTAPTYVNGERVGNRRLLGGERLQGGDVVVRFKMGRSG